MHRDKRFRGKEKMTFYKQTKYSRLLLFHVGASNAS